MTFYHFVKRVIDIILSSVGITVLSPLYLIIAVWIKVSSKGPIIYSHQRYGRNLALFKIRKFRTMVVHAREISAEKGVNSKELVTLPGKFLRRTFLDETAQLFNIWLGQMSIVGPRPIDKESYTRIFKGAKWKKIFSIKPGLTSLDSVADYLPQKELKRFEKHFKGLAELDNTTELLQHRYILDKYYLDNESFLLDVKIIYYTVLLALRKIFGG